MDVPGVDKAKIATDIRLYVLEIIDGQSGIFKNIASSDASGFLKALNEIKDYQEKIKTAIQIVLNYSSGHGLDTEAVTEILKDYFQDQEAMTQFMLNLEAAARSSYKDQ